METWKTKDGKEILLKDMTTQHIKNCIKAIEEEKITIGYTADMGYTGDGDGDGRIYEFIDTSNDYIKAFKEELIRRVI